MITDAILNVPDSSWYVVIKDGMRGGRNHYDLDGHFL